jgi:hypothetical protein
MSTLSGGPNVILDGLVLWLDAANTKSYISGSNIWNDLSRNNYSGSLINGPTFDSNNGGTIVFDGVDDYVQIDNPIILQNQNFSISVWFNITSATNIITSMIDYDHAAFQGWVIQSEDATTNRYYYLAYYNGSSFEPQSNFGVGKGVQLTNNVWQNLVYTKNGTAVIGYLNGTQVYSATASTSTVSYQPSKNLRIGGAVSVFANRSFNGRVATTQIYNRALSQQEILQNYNATKTRFGLS